MTFMRDTFTTQKATLLSVQGDLENTHRKNVSRAQKLNESSIASLVTISESFENALQ